MKIDIVRVRERLHSARLLLLFTPAACAGRDPLEVLEAALPEIDIVQVRPKLLGEGSTAHAPCDARATFDWTIRVLDLLRAHPELDVVVTVDDRVDVALALADAGCAGVHLGDQDCPVEAARALLGDRAVIGLSTHSLAAVVEAAGQDVDYLGFGPVHATRTKGYERGLGAEAAGQASATSRRPLFPIGGITRANAGELAGVGRAAVASAILSAADPKAAARELRALLTPAAPLRD